jgi:starvation-inducible outer membrane lipoprotein
MKPKYKVGDTVRFVSRIARGVTAVINKVDDYDYHYMFIAHYNARMINTELAYPIEDLEEETRLIIGPSKIWKELNEA